jgi:hypothetical protein
VQPHDLVESPAVERFPLAWFKRFRVPVVGHFATFDPLAEGFDEGGLYKLARIRVDPPGTTRLIRY